MENNIETMGYDLHIDNGQILRFHMVNGVVIKGILVGYTDSVYVIGRDIAGLVSAVIIIKNNVVFIDVDPDVK